MLSVYLKMAWRNIKSNKLFAFLNVIGLTCGMGIALLIGLWVYFEYSYDRFLPNYNELYKVKLNVNSNGKITTQDAAPLPLVQTLKNDIPGIKSVIETDFIVEHGLKVDDKKLYLPGAYVGKGFLETLKYPLLSGDASQCLNDPYSIALCKSTAISLFGTTNCINKTVRFDNQHDLMVTAVLDDIPKNASIKFDYLVPFAYNEIMNSYVKQARSQWVVNSSQILLSISTHTPINTIQASIKDLIRNNSSSKNVEVTLQPLKDIRFYSEYENGKPSGGFIKYVRFFTVIGILSLIIACINFVNLSIAQTEKRAKAVGVRKVLGSSKTELIIAFLLESLFLTFLAAVLSIGIVQLLLPSFNLMAESNVRIPYLNATFWLCLLSFILFTALLAGTQPAFYFSSFKPMKVLKAGFRFNRSGFTAKEIFVVFQFTCSALLIISTILIFQQIKHGKDRPAGFDANRLILTDINPDLSRNYTALKNELLNSGIVTGITKSSNPITAIYAHTPISSWPNKKGDEAMDVATIAIDEDYFKTVSLKILEGNSFKPGGSSNQSSVILNKAAIELMNLNNPVGQTINWNGQNLQIIGVADDAVMDSPFKNIGPTLFIYMPGWESSIMYRLSPQIGTKTAIEKLNTIFNKYSPAYPFVYNFADQVYERKFSLETLIGKLAGIFSFLAIFVSCLGLFGISAQMMQKKKREISIRKVLGASNVTLWVMLTKKFMVLISVSCLLASATGWFFLNKWLANYEYRVTFQSWIFIAATGMVLLIALVTISFKVVQVSSISPAKTLNAE